MNNVAPIIGAIAAVITSLSLIITAIAKFRTVAAEIEIQKQEKTKKAEPIPPKNSASDRSFVTIALVVIILGQAGLVIMLFQHGPATKHDIAIAAMCLSNILSGYSIWSSELSKKLASSRVQ